MKKKMMIVLLVTITSLLFCETSSTCWFPKIGNITGHTEASIGFHFWNDHLHLRNLQYRFFSYLYPGIRFNSVIRSNKEMNVIEIYKDSKPVYNKIEPNLDELYLELLGFNYNKFGTISGSLKLGKIRYLRFPYYDNISILDQVPGLTDMRDGDMSGYYGELLCLDYFSNYGFGYHSSVIHWDLFERNGFDILENYLFFRKNFSFLEFESRVGYLQTRQEPVGVSATGYSAYLGAVWKDYHVGIYYENIDDKIYTGFGISFAPSKVTSILGAVKLDYTRADEGFSMQIPAIKYNFGILTDNVPEHAVLVGTIQAERVITFWRAGMMRNFYEHIISKTGDTYSDDLIVRINEKPMRLDNESIISPVYEFDSIQSLKEWNSSGMRFGQYSQDVVYEFYRINE